MIWYYVILFFTSVLNVAFSWVPRVTELPFGVDNFLSLGFGYAQSFTQEVWIFAPVYACILFYIHFKLVMIIMKVFLGARAPYA